MAETFAIWQTEKKKNIDDLVDMTRIVLSDNPVALWKQVTKIDSWLGYAYLILAQADGWLDEEEYQALKKVRVTYTEKLSAYEKEVEVKKVVREVREFRDTVRGLAEAIKQKVMLGQSGLKSFGKLPQEYTGDKNG